MTKIILNPGHGPKNTGIFDPGAVGAGGTREADINLAVARLLAPLLEAAGSEVLLIRDGDLGDVTAQANASGGDYFISLHCNSFGEPSAQGTETYVYQADSPAKGLAEAIQAAVVRALGTADRGVKTAGYYVLRKTAMPALLVELAFLSNPAEEGLLADAGTQQRLVLALADAIMECLGIRPAAAAEQVQVTLHGEEGQKEFMGRLIDGVTYLPARAVLEALGYRVEWRPGQVEAWEI